MQYPVQTTGSELSLIDLSSVPRDGVKGKELSEWLDSRAYDVGAASNHAYLQGDGVLIARLSPSEILLLSNPAAPAAASMTKSLEATYTCYPVRRQDSHFWFAVTGSRGPAMFAKLCSVNLSPQVFGDGMVAQTSVARTSAVIVRHDVEDVLSYYLLGDSSMSLYMWNCIVDAMQEFNNEILMLPALDDAERS
jgi:sarcosine oxidase subunit gamma